jgi:hypothetical protein
MSMDLIADELFEVGFATDVELVTNPCELVCPGLCHFQCKQLHFTTIDHHGSLLVLGFVFELADTAFELVNIITRAEVDRLKQDVALRKGI